MVSFDTDGKTRRVQSAGSLLYSRAVHEALATAREPIGGRVKKGFRKAASWLTGDIKVLSLEWLIFDSLAFQAPVSSLIFVAHSKAATARSAPPGSVRAPPDP
jgi:hypothetical protein